MRNKKVVLRNFRYCDCDAMALFLEKMAVKGWHFASWRVGMVFERGEPRRESYAVEVFPNGSEMDLKPSEDAQEYAQYCREAGWELVDSRRKFCIFRRIKEDAVPIVTPEERFQNIKSAQWKALGTQICSEGLITALFWLQFLTFNFKVWIFSNLMLFLMAVCTFGCVWCLIMGARLLQWGRKKKNELSSGIVPFYGNVNGRVSILSKEQDFILILLFGGIAIISMREGEYRVAMCIGIIAAIVTLLTALLAFIRPSRNELYWIQIGSGFFGVFVIIAVVLAVFTNDRSAEAENIKLTNVPLIQEDYKDMSDLPYSTKAEYAESMMGRMEIYQVEYEMGSMADIINYTVYTSSHPWVLERLWKQEIGQQEKREGQLTDAAPIWDARKALMGQSGVKTYSVFYEDKMMVLWGTSLDLDEAQIQKIRQKLELH